MDNRVRVHTVAIALCLVLCSGSTSGLDDCVTVEQDGASLLYNSTRLVCRVKESVKCGFFIVWDIDAKVTATFERHAHHVTVNNRYPDQYDCEWREDEKSAVLTIKRTTLEHEGYWYCNFMADDGRTDSQFVNVVPLGMVVRFLHVCIYAYITRKENAI